MTFNAFDHRRSTAAQNKGLMRPLRGSRRDRDDTGALGDITSYGPNTTWRDLSSFPGENNQWSSNLHRKQLVRREGFYKWDNIAVTGEHWALKWGTREYNAPYRQFVDCDFTDISQEHGLHVSNSSSTFLKDCTFLRCGSQGAQWAHRPLAYQQYDADNMPYAHPPRHGVVGCHFVDNAYKGTRPSFNLTYFNPGTSEMPGTLLVADSVFVCDWEEERYDGRRSTGAIVVTPSQGNEPLDGRLGPMMDSVTINNCLFDYTDGDRPIVDLRSVGKVVLKDSVFIGRDHRQAYIRIDRDKYGQFNGATSGQVVIQNCVGVGVELQIMRPSIDGSSKQESVFFDINTTGQEAVIDVDTCEIVSLRRL